MNQVGGSITDDGNSGVHLSSDGGANWNVIEGRVEDIDPPDRVRDLTEGQEGYNLAIDVSLNDPDVVALGRIHTFLSFDGGKRWSMPGINRKKQTTNP